MTRWHQIRRLDGFQTVFIPVWSLLSQCIVLITKIKRQNGSGDDDLSFSFYPKSKVTSQEQHEHVLFSPKKQIQLKQFPCREEARRSERIMVVSACLRSVCGHRWGGPEVRSGGNRRHGSAESCKAGKLQTPQVEGGVADEARRPASDEGPTLCSKLLSISFQAARLSLIFKVSWSIVLQLSEALSQFFFVHFQIFP